MLDHIVQRLPNVTHLTLSWCPCPINLPFMAINLPNLQYLTLDHTEEITVGAGEQPALFSSLVQLSLTRYGTSPMKHGALSCIIHNAPYVHTLIIRGYLISKESLDRFTEQSNQSVISLVTGLRAWDRSHREQVDHLLALFPNTRCLKLIIVDYSDIRSMREHHPNVNFINVKASRYSY
ncbi:hypothetical protein GQ42DRAFT_29794 [Ramicandelaber brevisporus]|nr:hypothetical protein GQ42DRAFT_29794 [Ramicandelaber brevisporus]